MSIKHRREWLEVFFFFLRTLVIHHFTRSSQIHDAFVHQGKVHQLKPSGLPLSDQTISIETHSTRKNDAHKYNLKNKNKNTRVTCAHLHSNMFESEYFINPPLGNEYQWYMPAYVSLKNNLSNVGKNREGGAGPRGLMGHVVK